MSGEEIITNCGLKKYTNVEITQVDYKVDHTKNIIFILSERAFEEYTPKISAFGRFFVNRENQ